MRIFDEILETGYISSDRKRRKVKSVKQVKLIPRDTDAEAICSSYLHGKRYRVEERQARPIKMNDRPELRSLDFDRVSKILTGLGTYREQRDNYFWVLFRSISPITVKIKFGIHAAIIGGIAAALPADKAIVTNPM